MKSLQTEITDHGPQVEKAVSDTEVLITQSQSSVKQELQAKLHGKCSAAALEISFFLCTCLQLPLMHKYTDMHCIHVQVFI